MEHIRRVVWRFPAFGQVRRDDKCARSHLRPDLMPYESVVDEAQRHVRLEARSLMRIKVYWIIPSPTQDPATLGRSSFGIPQEVGIRQQPGRQHSASRKAGFQYVAAPYTM